MKENGFSGFFLHFNRSFICVNNIKWLFEIHVCLISRDPLVMHIDLYICIIFTCHDRAEMLLSVVLNTNHLNNQYTL
jgi:hypothetical protein